MAGTWTALRNQPTFNASTMILLTDGTVLCHDEGPNQDGSNKWYKFTPDATGGYENGTWSSVADSPNSPLFYGSGVLMDGRVFVAGGEYNGSKTAAELLAAEIYDPIADTWTSLSTPAGWTQIGDCACCVLPDGRVLIAPPGPSDKRTAIYDPVANSWTAAANKVGPASSEESWVLLPDQSVLTVNCFGHPATEKYLIAADKWVTAGNTLTDLIEASSNEIGPGVLLPDGRTLFIGSTGRTAVYTMPAVASAPGTWASGPTLPTSSGQQLIAKDAPGCLLPNGRVLFAVSPQGPCAAVNQGYCPPTFFYEFDPDDDSLASVTAPPNSTKHSFNGRMLMLPSGQVMYSDGSTDVELYTPDGGPDDSWKPVITDYPASLRPGRTYTLKGKQLNGLSQCSTYGDDATMATNYPLVRLTDTTNRQVFWCRTHDFSTLGVATGNVVHSCKFSVLAGVPYGTYTLCVVVNGIIGGCRMVTVSNKRFKDLKWELKENFKRELDVVQKLEIEIKFKDGAGEGDPFKRFEGDPAWFEVIKTLAERSDHVEGLLAKGKEAFIKAAERPLLGEETLEDDSPSEE